jgi:hypothetical protein
MSRIGLGLCVTIAWVAGGCVGSFVETTPLNTAPRPLAPRAPSSVEVYASSPPTRAHVDVALLRANQPNLGEVDTPRMMLSLVEQAAKMGCDAIFVSGAAQRQGASDDLWILDPGSRAMLATCIAYLPNSVPLEAAAAPVNAIVLVPPEPGESKQKPAAIVDNVGTSSQRR